MNAEAEIKSETATSQGTPKTVVSDQKLGKKHVEWILPEPPEGTNFIDTLSLDFELPEIWENTFLLL